MLFPLVYVTVKVLGDFVTVGQSQPDFQSLCWARKTAVGCSCIFPVQMWALHYHLTVSHRVNQYLFQTDYCFKEPQSANTLDTVQVFKLVAGPAVKSTIAADGHTYAGSYSTNQNKERRRILVALNETLCDLWWIRAVILMISIIVVPCLHLLICAILFIEGWHEMTSADRMCLREGKPVSPKVM